MINSHNRMRRFSTLRVFFGLLLELVFATNIALAKNDCAYSNFVFACPRERISIKFQNTNDTQYYFTNESAARVSIALANYPFNALSTIHTIVPSPYQYLSIPQAIPGGISIPVAPYGSLDRFAYPGPVGLDVGWPLANHLYESLTPEDKDQWDTVVDGRSDEISFASTYDIWSWDSHQVMERAMLNQRSVDNGTFNLPIQFLMETLFVASLYVLHHPEQVNYFSPAPTENDIFFTDEPQSITYSNTQLSLGPFVFFIKNGAITEAVELDADGNRIMDVCYNHPVMIPEGVLKRFQKATKSHSQPQRLLFQSERTVQGNSPPLTPSQSGSYFVSPKSPPASSRRLQFVDDLAESPEENLRILRLVLRILDRKLFDQNDRRSFIRLMCHMARGLSSCPFQTNQRCPWTFHCLRCSSGLPVLQNSGRVGAFRISHT